VPVALSFVTIVRRSLAALAAIGLLALAIDRTVALPVPAGDGGPAGLSGSTPGHLVVSEVMTGGASASDEFIELYNPSQGTQPLEGLEVVYVTSTGATVTRKAAWAAGAAGMPPGAHLLIANSTGIFAGLADVSYANGLAATGGSVALRVQGAAAAIDAVGWGTAASTWLETRAAPAVPAGSSLERLPGGSAGSSQDGDDNLLDFAIQPIPDPQNSGSAPIVIGTPTPTPSETPSPSASPSATPSPTSTATPTPIPTPTPSPTPTATPSPISIAEARSQPDGAAVLVEGVALTDGDFTDGGGYLVDATSGISVLLSDGTFARGQLVRVAGTVDDRFSQRTIRTSAVQITQLGTGSEPLPIDAETGSIGEAVEGQLIEVTGLIASSATILSNGVAWDLDDGTGPVRVVIGSATGIDTAGWERGVELTLIGVVGQRDSSGSGMAGFRVQPRDAADVIAVEPAATPSPTPSPTAEPTATPSATASATPSSSATTRPTVAPSATPNGVPLVSIGEARGAVTGTHLRVRGVVTAQSGLVEAGSAVVQDSTGAILVRMGSRAGGMALGQLVEVDGVRATKAGMLSLRVSKPPLPLGTLADPTPIRRATGALGEAHEAHLVITRGMVSTAVSRPKGGAVSFSIDDGSGPIRVTISPRSGIATATIKRGAWLELRGVLGQATTSKAPLKGYRLWPRMRADLVVMATPVAGAGATSPCCNGSGPSAVPHAGGLLPKSQQGDLAAPGQGVPPIVARPHPTFAAAPPITTGQPTATEHHAPREAGLVISGMGLAALAGLAAWLGRRRRSASGHPASELEPGPLETGPEHLRPAPLRAAGRGGGRSG
jgi:Lamin Tail Domain